MRVVRSGGVVALETPKLGAVAVTSLTANDFAAALDRAIARSGKAPLMIEARAEPEQVD